MATTVFAPKAEGKPWRVDTFMNTDEWKEVSLWYPFSLRSLMPDGRWSERARCKMRDDAYQIMKARASTKPRDYFVMVQCTLVGNDGPRFHNLIGVVSHLAPGSLRQIGRAHV